MTTETKVLTAHVPRDLAQKVDAMAAQTGILQRVVGDLSSVSRDFKAPFEALQGGMDCCKPALCAAFGKPEGCKLAAVYDVRDFVEAGGLISYGQGADRFRQVGAYVGKILHGATPADLPVVRPSKFELVVNRKAAKAVNLDLPAAILSQADEVID